MTDIAITAANVVPGANARLLDGTAGETIAAGKTCYKNSSDLWMLADSDSATAGAKDGTAISVNSASLNQPIKLQKGGALTIGGTVTAGDPYFISSTAGGICPYGDLSSGEKVVQVGVATSAAIIEVEFINTGVTK